MAKGIYVGVGGQTVSGNIIPKTWTGSISPYKSNGITLTASGEASGYPATNACDGDASTNTFQADVTEYWIKLLFPTAQKITKMKTRVSALSVSKFSNAIIQGCNNYDDWNDLYTISSPQTTLTEITLNNPDYYRYYRIYATSTNASSPPMVYEWQVSQYIQKPVARKVKKAYVGVDSVARKVKKGYIGVNGVAQLFYSAETLVPFTSCPFPNFTTNTATDKYGTWTVSCSSQRNSTTYAAYNAFDTDTGTLWGSGKLTTNFAYVQLDFPQGVSIKPTTVIMTYASCGTGSCVQGYNPDTGEWVTIANTSQLSTSNKVESFAYSGTAYFTAIRAYVNTYSSSYAYVSNLKITAGTLKIE